MTPRRHWRSVIAWLFSVMDRCISAPVQEILLRPLRHPLLADLCYKAMCFLSGSRPQPGFCVVPSVIWSIPVTLMTTHCLTMPLFLWPQKRSSCNLILPVMTV